MLYLPTVSRIPKYHAGTSSRIFWYPAGTFDIQLEQKDNIMFIGIKLQSYICHQTEVFRKVTEYWIKALQARGQFEIRDAFKVQKELFNL